MIATGHDLVIYSYTELVERNELKNTEITTFILRLIVKQTNVFDCHDIAAWSSAPSFRSVTFDVQSGHPPIVPRTQLARKHLRLVWQYTACHFSNFSTYERSAVGVKHWHFLKLRVIGGLF